MTAAEIGLFAQVCGCLLQVLSPMRLLAGGSEQRGRKFQAFRLWRNE